MNKLIQWYKNKFDEEASFIAYLMFAVMVIGIVIILTGCAAPVKKEKPHTYRVELGKKCIEKPDGTVAWSYVWIARDDVVLVKCKNQ